MRRSTLAFSAFLSSLVAACALSCGNGAGSGQGPTTPKPVASSSTAKAIPEDRQLCSRVCAVQTRCGGNMETCTQKCLPIVRVLEADIGESMVKCIETNGAGKCDEGEEGIAKRKKLVGTCVVDVTKDKVEQARINIDLFSKAFCDATKTCGNESGTFSPSTCLGSAKGSIMDTQYEYSGGLYGALRPSKVDDIVACMKGPCEKRRKEAAQDLDRCLDEVLAKAADAAP